MKKLKSLLAEILRYSAVGITAFFLDTALLVVCKEFFLRRFGAAGTMAGTGIGFTGGSVYNYVFSNHFVFRSENDRLKARPFRSFSIFMTISLIGLAFTEIGMAAGIHVFGDRHYPLIKVAVAALVFLWNYSARKLTLYRKSGS